MKMMKILQIFAFYFNKKLLYFEVQIKGNLLTCCQIMNYYFYTDNRATGPNWPRCPVLFFPGGGDNGREGPVGEY